MDPIAATFHSAAPILRVADLVASLDYYVRVLGFAIDWRDDTGIASVSRDRCTLMLCQGDQGHAGAWVCVGVADAAAFIDVTPFTRVMKSQVSVPEVSVTPFMSSPANIGLGPAARPLPPGPSAP